MTLGIIIVVIAVWWIRTTLKEANKSRKDSQTKK